ncbi:MAG: nucleotidyltransferase domain-containing protein [Bacillota bacterium]
MSENILQSLIDKMTLELKTIYGDKLREIIVFGSQARGDADEWSDIDIMVLVDIPKDEIADYDRIATDSASRIGVSNGVLISLLTQNTGFFNHWKQYLPLYANIKNEGKTYYAA